MKDYYKRYKQIMVVILIKYLIGRFTILCDNPTKLQTAVAVMKKAEQFHLIVSEDKDFFDKQSKTHHRFHNIKLYVQNTTYIQHWKDILHLFYEHIRAWKLNNNNKIEEASDETLTKINDVICEWIDTKK
ncbi:hypothetical protein RFI_16856 [Reticulomyxa filosa]|uniref:Uncharacterized protein n=1 Tax=Reticulomyxa filosa TaxID=46433 RepID=X6N270_RETFI|nr:hypothetical protein RFI_16856 [Reticulomyxa filosa]|eukprot:ETO20360.1 hypothetical protein RFI_16856 [Reticulomyxa filosa]